VLARNSFAGEWCFAKRFDRRLSQLFEANQRGVPGGPEGRASRRPVLTRGSFRLRVGDWLTGPLDAVDVSAQGCCVAFDISATNVQCGTPEVVIIDAATGCSCCIAAENALA
jgi:hypothetical protein